MIRALAVGLVLCAGQMAFADGMTGRTVSFQVQTYDDPAAPILLSNSYFADVRDGPEFGLEREGHVGMDVVPVVIDVSDTAVTFSYAQMPQGSFARAAFNGYVMTFPGDCALIQRAKIDQTGTTDITLAPDALSFGPNELRLNVSELTYRPTTRIAVKISVADCPLS